MDSFVTASGAGFDSMKLGTFLLTPKVPVVVALVMGLIFWWTTVASEPAWSPTQLGTPIQVQVIGRDFYWRFRFPGPDQKFNTKDDASVERELHLPADRDVVFMVTSDDYIYTMAIPDLDIRQIAVPELTFPLRLRVSEQRSFEITTDPLCGVRLLHDDDMGKITVQSADAFDSWYRTIQ